MQDRVLAYWRTLELFQPHAPPKEQRYTRKQRKPVFVYRRDDPLPWQSGHALARDSLPNGRKWQHRVYAGIYSTQKYRQNIEEIIGRDEQAFDRRETEGCHFCFVVDQEGHPNLQSLDVSAAIWALGQTQKLGPDDSRWLAGDFGAWAAEWQVKFAREFAGVPRLDGESDASFIERAYTQVPIDHDCLEAMGRFFFNKTLADRVEMRIQSYQVSARRTNEMPPGGLLNSFFAGDLKRMATEAQTRTPTGDALDDYLGDPAAYDARETVNIARDSRAQVARLHPSQFPVGRWPEANGHPLAFSQQVAVNDIWSELRQTPGLRSVNGPPGTGKTTLLRDLVAAVVVERAQALAKCQKPGDAFAASSEWRFGDKTVFIQRWIAPLRGHGLVATSANNGAVENISLELPEASSINAQAIEGLDYFSDLATELLRDSHRAPEDQLRGWGLLAARLGNKSNNDEFATRFWWRATSQGDRTASEAPASFRQHLYEVRPTEPWLDSVKRFQAAVDHEQRLRDERVRVANALHEEPAQVARVQDANNALKDADAQLKHAAAQVDKHAGRVEARQKATKAARDAMAQHQATRPSFFKRLFLRRRTREWREQAKLLSDNNTAALSDEKIAKGYWREWDGKHGDAVRQKDRLRLGSN
ncbi:hypothetical protein [Salinisphaera sp. LB1]|uniref:hypothetical protein n=1 Tax=Salinisphaera sp. LB1 TaxID=2183911 RepID=UPI0011AB4178|nr:hypothetical protein [Salinisphaera sp. LB1]